MCIYFILHLHTVYTFGFCYFILKLPKRGLYVKKSNIFFLLCRIQICSIFPKSTQATNYWQKCLGCYFLLTCQPLSTYAEISQTFLIPNLPCMHCQKKNGVTKTIDYTFSQTSTPALSLTRIRTLSIDSNLKMSTILFALRYIRYKVRVKS